MRTGSAVSLLLIMILFFALMIFVSNINVNYAPTVTPPPILVEQPEDGWAGMIFSPEIFSSEQLEEMIPKAPHYSQTRPSLPHPLRRMSEFEREQWIEDYYNLGGINAQELEIYKIVNEIRAQHDLPPFVLCPKISMAARLFSYLQVYFHSSGHTDPYYENLMERTNFFGRFGILYMENANSEQWYEMTDGTVEYVYLSPQELVDGWFDSEPHREHILSPETTHAGFGVDSGKNRVVPTMKSIVPVP
ncbi:MAG: CAP domain-containing protein [Defluviitaleaceae bacterium]|nr:CAP domain-containing protein [Defluviitaleaceae bacterium]